MKSQKAELVNHPEHYQGKGLEVIHVIEAFDLGFSLGNAVKYILREWRHFFRLRTARAAHPQMRDLAISMLMEFWARIPVVFDDIKIGVAP